MNTNEQIIVEDIEVKAGQHCFSLAGGANLTSDPDMSSRLSTEHLHAASVDDQWLQNASMASSQPPLLDSGGSFRHFLPFNNNSENTHLFTDDLLISGSLADIPVEQSPFLTRHRMTIPGDSGSLREMERLSSGGSFANIHQEGSGQFDDDSAPSSSQEWSLSQEKDSNMTSPEWFPDSNVKQFESLSYPGYAQHTTGSADSGSKTGGASHESSVAGSESKRFTQRLKQTILNLTSGSLNRKTSKHASSSTSSLQRLRTTSFTSSLDRHCHSSECMRIKPPKKGRPSLAQLTRVSSADNVLTAGTSWLCDYPQRTGREIRSAHWKHFKHSTLDSRAIDNSGPRVSEMPATLKSTSSDASPSQFDEQIRSLSGEETLVGSGAKSRLTHSRSYRSQRQRLHHSRTSSHSTLSEEDNSSVGSPLSTPVRRAVQTDPHQPDLIVRRNMGRRPYRPVRILKQQAAETAGSTDLSALRDSPPSVSEVSITNVYTASSIESPATRHGSYQRPLTKSASLNEPSVESTSTLKQHSIERSPVQPGKHPVHKTLSLNSTLTGDKSPKKPYQPFPANRLAARGVPQAIPRIGIGPAFTSALVNPTRPAATTEVTEPSREEGRETRNLSRTTMVSEVH